jgi:hypothetical protein
VEILKPIRPHKDQKNFKLNCKEFDSLKKEKRDFYNDFRLYGRFLSTKMVTAKPMMIATIIAATAGTKYMSTTDCGAAGGGVAVAAGSAAWKAVDAEDG